MDIAEILKPNLSKAKKLAKEIEEKTIPKFKVQKTKLFF